MRRVSRQKPGWKPAGAWLLIGILVVLAGCGLKFAYRHADWLILWQLDHYVDLSFEQRRDLATRLKPLLARHRQEALPRYEAFLTQVKQRFQKGLTDQDLHWFFVSYDDLRADLFDRIVTDGGVLLASLDQQQVRNLEEVLRKENEKAERQVFTPAQVRLAKRSKATIEWLEEWVGPLSREQEEQITQWSVALPDTQKTWLDYQKSRQQELLELLHHPRNAESAARELRAMLVYPDSTGPPEYQQAVRQMRAAVKAMALAIDRTLTPTQRNHAVSKLQTVIDQFHELRLE